MAYPGPQGSTTHPPSLPPGALSPTSKLELHFSCKNLKNLDVLSKSDPQVIVYLKDRLHSQWTEIGKTEIVKDNLSPVFTKTVIIDYFFEEVQHLRLLVVDIDTPTRKQLEKKDLVGEIETTVAAIVGSKASTLVKNLKHPENLSIETGRGIIIVTAEEVMEQKQAVMFQIACRGLDKKDFFGKSDPFIRILKSREDGQWLAIHQTEEIKKTLDPTWRPFEISMQKLNNGDLDRTLLFQVFDWNKSGKEDPIGEFKASIRELVAGVQSNKDWEVVNPEYKRKKRNYKNSGIAKFIRCEIMETYSFFDYLKGGCGISLVVGVDFTASNGDPNYCTSLHYRNPYELNEYGKAIVSVGEILGYYDSDNMYPIYGFGGKFGPQRQISHCYALTGDPSRPEVYGVGGLLEAYQRALHNVELYGPTNFAPIISQAAAIASQHVTQSTQQYTILLIITDGEITDMDATIEQIVKASSLPLSIVIVGVGTADFTNMNILDADDRPLVSNGITQARDIVQFVPMRNFKDQHYSRFAAEVLAEIPHQLVDWMKSRGIKPNPPPAPSFDPMASINAQVFAGNWAQSIAPGAGQVLRQDTFTGLPSAIFAPGPQGGQPKAGAPSGPSGPSGPPPAPSGPQSQPPDRAGAGGAGGPGNPPSSAYPPPSGAYPPSGGDGRGQFGGPPPSGYYPPPGADGRAYPPPSGAYPPPGGDGRGYPPPGYPSQYGPPPSGYYPPPSQYGGYPIPPSSYGNYPPPGATGSDYGYPPQRPQGGAPPPNPNSQQPPAAGGYPPPQSGAPPAYPKPTQPKADAGRP